MTGSSHSAFLAVSEVIAGRADLATVRARLDGPEFAPCGLHRRLWMPCSDSVLTRLTRETSQPFSPLCLDENRFWTRLIVPLSPSRRASHRSQMLLLPGRASRLHASPARPGSGARLGSRIGSITRILVRSMSQRNHAMPRDSVPTDPFFRDAIGFDSYSSPGQALAVRCVEASRSRQHDLVSLPTGSGKERGRDVLRSPTGRARYHGRRRADHRPRQRPGGGPARHP